MIESVRAFSVAFTISVANIDRSFADNRSPSSCMSSFLAALVRGFATALVLFTFVDTIVFEFLEGFDLSSAFKPTGFGSSRTLSSVTVAGKHVDVEVTAARMESADSFKEGIMEQKQTAVLVGLKHYPRRRRKGMGACYGSSIQYV